MKKVLAIMAASLAMFWAHTSTAAVRASAGDSASAPTCIRPLGNLVGPALSAGRLTT